MEPPFPSYTPTWRNDTYAAINPTHPENSQAGKTVIVTGAGGGIGCETAVAFAQAGAKHIVLVGRTEATLRETQKLLLAEKCKSTVCVASVSSVEQMKIVTEAAGTWDVFILNAGHLARPTTIAEADIEDWWSAYETNVKAILIAAQLFLPTANPKDASFLAVTAGGVVLDPEQLPGLSAYMTSKTAQNRVVEWIGAENPNLFTCSVHPGVVLTKMFHDSGLKGMPCDSEKLPAHFMVWLANPQKTRFLNGRFVWVNWDVGELCERADEMVNSNVTRINAVGWPYPHTGSKVVDDSL